jgi:hypothetical protein
VSRVGLSLGSTDQCPRDDGHAEKPRMNGLEERRKVVL